MPQVITFTNELRIFNTKNELVALDKQVNDYIKANHIQKIHSISDTTTTDDSGATIGIIRVLAFD